MVFIRLLSHFSNYSIPEITNINNDLEYQLLHKIAYYKYNITTQFDNKFIYLNELVLKNTEIDNIERGRLFSMFSNAQFYYHKIIKFAHLCKLKYSKKYDHNYDLYYNDLSLINKQNIIKIIENNIVYTFRYSDIIRIINKSLCNCTFFIADPNLIKNPYTNLPFSLSNMYNIYFRLKSSSFKIPELFFCLFNTNFNYNTFKNNYECLIREKYIQNFTNMATSDDLYQQIMTMIYMYNNILNIIIDLNYPKKNLINTFKPYIKTFLYSEYSLNPYIKEINKNKLELDLKLFTQTHYFFGTRILLRKRTLNGNQIYTFADAVYNTLYYDYQYNNPQNNIHNNDQDDYDEDDEQDDEQDDDQDDDGEYNEESEDEINHEENN